MRAYIHILEGLLKKNKIELPSDLKAQILAIMNKMSLEEGIDLESNLKEDDSNRADR